MALRPKKDLPQPTPPRELANAIFIINTTRAAREEVEDGIEHTKAAIQETLSLLASGTAWEFTPLGIMEQREHAFGPFETKKLAAHMIPSVLDEEGRDWKGHIWTYGTLPMIWDDFLDPNFQVPRAYWCRKCGKFQTFKGSCSTCRANGHKFVPTIEIKDWESEV